MKKSIFTILLSAIGAIQASGAYSQATEQLLSECYFNAWNSSCCFVSFCDDSGFLTKPSIKGFHRSGGLFDSPNFSCKEAVSTKFKSKEDCERVFATLPNICVLNIFTENRATLDIVQDNRRVLPIEEKNKLLIELTELLNAGQFQDAFIIALKVPLTQDEYQNFFINNHGKSVNDFHFNRMGFVLDESKDPILNHLDHFICEAGKASLKNRLMEQGRHLYFPEDYEK